MTLTKFGETDGRRRARSVGSRCNLASAVSASDSPIKGTRPAKHSYKTSPRPYRSARPSSGLPRTCSGERYFAVPIMMLSLVRSSPLETSALAIPKSASKQRASFVIKIFPGLTSRCTKFCLCASSRAAATAKPIWIVSCGCSFFCLSSTSRKLFPSTYCIMTA